MRENVGQGWARDTLLLVTGIGLALLGVVGVVVGFAVHQLLSGRPPEIDDWPLRGSLAGDEALLDRAEQAWRDFGGPDGDVHPVFAERSSGLAVNTVLVVMAGRTDDDRPVVAFVTSPATTGTPHIIASSSTRSPFCTPAPISPRATASTSASSCAHVQRRPVAHSTSASRSAYDATVRARLAPIVSSSSAGTVSPWA